MNYPARLCLAAVLSCSALAAKPLEVPDWARPGSATHQQVPPPAGHQQPTVTFAEPIGIFDGQADVGGPILSGSASFDAATKSYRIDAAGYNIWYFRDEFRFLWKKLSGDVSLAADISFPNAEGYGDRKTVLIVRQDLDDNAKEIMAALHGVGLIHLAQRPEKGADLKEDGRIEAAEVPMNGPKPVRLGIEKRGDQFTLWVSVAGEPMRQVGAPVTLKFDAPFYVGIGFTSHVPDQMDATVVSNVILENSAGQVR
ncbi:MAG: hypothetical protein NVV63_14955 [Opitutus sp.]|nr:hypothetical protein [Opitutus sp.]